MISKNSLFIILAFPIVIISSFYLGYSEGICNKENFINNAKIDTFITIDKGIEGIYIALSSNNDVREYHVRFRDLTDLEINSIFQIPGIITDYNSPIFDPNNYTLRVYKGTAFNWKEIEPKIIEILKNHNIK